jgi:hypothetical protein
MHEPAPPNATLADCRVTGRAVAYRLVDVGYGIDLDRASALLGDSGRERIRPSRAHAELIEIRNPPILARLGPRSVTIDGRPMDVDVSAHLFDFGVVSVRLRAIAPENVTWPEFVEFGRAFDDSSALAEAVQQEVDRIVGAIASAIDRPSRSDIIEDYTIFRIDRACTTDGRALPPSVFQTVDLVRLLSAERETLSPEAQAELLSRQFSYFAHDLVVLTWDSALVVEPDRTDHDAEYVIEFANAQLLELRVYDALLDAELPTLYDRIEDRRRRPWPTRRYRPLLAEVQTRVADITEIVERADNGFKVVNDVYLARVYLAALEVFREQAWRRGIDRKLGIFRDTYSMLNAEAQAARGELLELMIILLFIADIALSFLN